jgi:hypothetical protein
MNKRSVKKRLPVKAVGRPVEVKAASRQVPLKAEQTKTAVAGVSAHPAPVHAVAAHPPARGPSLRAHKFRVGQTVLYTSSPIARPGASGTYTVVKLLPSDGEDYQYRIKNSDEAFERVAKESQLELDR